MQERGEEIADGVLGGRRTRRVQQADVRHDLLVGHANALVLGCEQVRQDVVAGIAPMLRDDGLEELGELSLRRAAPSGSQVAASMSRDQRRWSSSDSYGEPELPADGREREDPGELGHQVGLAAAGEAVDHFVHEQRQLLVDEDLHRARSECGRRELTVEVVLRSLHRDERAPARRFRVHRVRRAARELVVATAERLQLGEADDHPRRLAEADHRRDAVPRTKVGEELVELVAFEVAQAEVDVASGVIELPFRDRLHGAPPMRPMIAGQPRSSMGT